MPFTVAGILKPDVLTDMKTALADSLRHGKTLTQFQDEVLPYFSARVDWAKG
ncbi:hypothetical protein [Sodalis sp. (in: enterobacteria)]|uniref:hypothetical protein n=1 Tax=Sodalis sp. (in: enterobacteria) TaxID=1898979 RepID=UPI003F688DD9